MSESSERASERLVSDAGDLALAPDLATVEVEAITSGPVPTPRLLRVGAKLALGWMIFLIAIAVLAPVLPIPDPAESIGGIVRQGPQPGHWFGGDAIGQDVLAQVIWGTRASLLVGFGAIALGLLVGVPVGLLAGYFRGPLDRVIVTLLDVMLSIPALILAISLTTFLGRSLFNVTLALGLIAIPQLARVVRANSLVYAEREFVAAARALGATHWRSMTREVLPNVVPALAATALLAVAVAIVAEGVLSVIGVGLPLDVPSWGSLIDEGRQALETMPWIAFFPCLFLFLTVISLNTLGDTIRQRFDAREGR